MVSYDCLLNTLFQLLLILIRIQYLQRLIDTTLYTDYHRNLVAKGAVIKFTMQFIEGHRKELKNKYKKFESFDEKFVVDDDMGTFSESGKWMLSAFISSP